MQQNHSQPSGPVEAGIRPYDIRDEPRSFFEDGSAAQIAGELALRAIDQRKAIIEKLKLPTVSIVYSNEGPPTYVYKKHQDTPAEDSAEQKTRSQLQTSKLLRSSRIYMLEAILASPETPLMKLFGPRHVLGSLRAAQNVLQLRQVARDSDG